MADPWSNSARAIDAPADKHFLLSPSDTIAIDPLPRAIHCQAAGTAIIEDVDGVVLPYAMVVGQVLSIRAKRLRTGSTGTFYGWV